MSDRTYDISGIELTDDTYTVVQSLVRNKYRAEDSAGNVVLRGKQKMLKLKEQFPFVDADGTEVFSVKAAGMLDVAGNYVLTDSRTGEDLVILDNDYSILQDTWTIRDADTEAALARIDSRGAMATVARNVLPFGHWIPHRYEITDANGAHVGTIAGKFSLADTYEITIDDAGGVPKEAVVAAAMVIDAIQGN
ncbi:LURP-one-related/scramblase family protein [Halobaculum rarum]|uniref:LURP-one-related/scramblase family protein n=1 Tax=Halobaculum rarum TaxID=3075122 RepID=UPI0032AEBC4B